MISIIIEIDDIENLRPAIVSEEARLLAEQVAQSRSLPSDDASIEAWACRLAEDTCFADD